MEYYYKKGSIENPMAGFESLYTKGGLFALEMEFIFKATRVEKNHSHVLDLKKDSYPNVHQDPNTLEIIENVYYFKDEINMRFSSLRREALYHFEKRLDQANSNNEEEFTLKKANKSIDKAISFIIDNPKIHLVDTHLSFLKELRILVNKIYTKKTGNYILADRKISDHQLEELSIKLWHNHFFEKSDNEKFVNFLKAEEPNKLYGTIKLGVDNRQFRYLLDKLTDYGILKLRFNQIEESDFFLNKSGNKFKQNDLSAAKYSSEIEKTSIAQKKKNAIDAIFLEVLGKKV